MILGKPIFLYQNLLKSYVPTVTSAAADYPATNLYDDDLNSFWKATGSGDQNITIDAGAGNTISADMFCIGNHNLFTAGAGVLLQASDDNFSTVVTVADLRPESNAYVHGLQRLIVGGDFEVWPGGASAAPAAFQVHGFAGGSVARESVIMNKKYSMKLTRNGADGGYKHVFLSNALNQVKGKTVAFGEFVYCSTANTARLTVNGTQLGQVNSAYHTGSGAWEWLTVVVTVPANETLLEVICDMVTNDTFAYFDVLRAKEGTSIISDDQSDVVITPLAKRYLRVALSGMSATPQIGELSFGPKLILPRRFLEGFDDRQKEMDKKVNTADGGQRETINFFKRNVYPCRIKNIAVGTQAETDMLAWLDAVEDGAPFWMLYDLRGAYIPDFVSYTDNSIKAPISGMRRDFSFNLEQEL